MKLLIVGSRSIQEFDLTPYVPADADLIITGGAEGIDLLAEQYADQHKISKLILRPQYHLFKRNAPLVRNRLMVDIADAVLVIWDGKSKGTLHTIEYAKKKDSNLQVIEI